MLQTIKCFGLGYPRINDIFHLSYPHLRSLVSLYGESENGSNVQIGAKNKRITISNDTLIVILDVDING